MALMPKPILALSLAALLKAPLGAQAPPAAKAGQADREQPAPAAPMPEGDRIARWVASRSILYPSRDDRGEARTYSGRVYLPARAGHPVPVPLVLYVHGSDVAFNSLPQFNRGYEAMMGAMAAYFYSYVVAMPDLPGYGLDPSGRPHPYCHAQSLAFATVDSLPAIQQTLVEDPYLAAHHYAWNGKLFLLGYSEGAYTTLAAVRELEAHPDRRSLFTLTASAAMAGPFDLSGAMRGAFIDPVPGYPRSDYLPYFVMCYHAVYGSALEPTQVLSAGLLADGPDGNVLRWLDGTMAGPEVDVKLGGRLGQPPDAINLRGMFNPEWLARELDGPAYAGSRTHDLLRDNDLCRGWRPTKPILFRHSPDDDDIPYANTLTTLAELGQAIRRDGGDPGALLFSWPIGQAGEHIPHHTGALIGLPSAFAWFALMEAGALGADPVAGAALGVQHQQEPSRDEQQHEPGHGPEGIPVQGPRQGDGPGHDQHAQGREQGRGAAAQFREGFEKGREHAAAGPDDARHEHAHE